MENSNKLGFAYQVCSQGLDTYPKCNVEGDWYGDIRDIRGYLKYFVWLAGDRPVTFVSYTEHGAFVVLLSSYTDNPGNYKAAWLYVPNSIKIEGEDLERACEKMRLLFSNPMSLAEIRGDILFTKTYPEKQCLDYRPSAKNGKLGVFRLTRYTLNEILGRFLYQEKFSEYEAIFLLGVGDGISIRNQLAGRVDDLTEDTLEEYCMLEVPDKDEIHGNPEILLNGKPFDKAIRVRKGTQLRISAKRLGFKDVEIVLEGPSQIKETLSKTQWLREIKAEHFNLIDADTKEPISEDQSWGANIIVEGHPLPTHPWLAENDCKNAKVQISLSGYEPYTWEHNLLPLEPIEIRLTRKVKTISGKIELANGHEADIEISSKFLGEYEGSGESPLRAYKYELDDFGVKTSKLVWKRSGLCFIRKREARNRTNEAVPPDEGQKRDEPDEPVTKSNKWKYRLEAVLVLLVLEIVCLIGYTLYKWWDPYWDNHYIEGRWWPPSIAIKVSHENQQSQPKAYLDRNVTWHRDSLKWYAEPPGLFDALNTFDVDAVKAIQESISSERLGRIVEALESHRDIDHMIGKPNRKYNLDGDTLINTANYISWVSTEHELPAALTYLDKNSRWHRDSLKRYDETPGLFDALNTFDVESVKAIHEKIYPQSKNLQCIVEALESHEKPYGKYNTEKDLQITIDKYIDRVSKMPKLSQQPSTGSATNKAGQTQ